jgi:hypothetical protein
MPSSLSSPSHSCCSQGIDRYSVSFVLPLHQSHTYVAGLFVRGRVNENHQCIILRLEDFKQLSHILNTGWDDWVAQAPPSWKEDNFITNNMPVGVTIRCGQNQPLLVHGALNDERRNWDNITITLIFGSLPSL